MENETAGNRRSGKKTCTIPQPGKYETSFRAKRGILLCAVGSNNKNQGEFFLTWAGRSAAGDTSLPWLETGLDWSPDGKYLAYVQEAAFSKRRDLDAQEHISGQPSEFRARIHQRFEGRDGQVLVLCVPGYDADFEYAHRTRS